MSLKDTTFKYYSGSNSQGLAKVGYDSTALTSFSLTPPSTMVNSDRQPSTPDMARSSTSVQRADSSRQRGSSSKTTMTTKFSVERVASNLRWSEQVSSVSEVIEQFGESLPLIVVVRRGYSGHEDGHASCHLATGQILQVSKTCEQVRVRARDENGRELSLPYDFPLTVRQKTTSGLGQPMRLSEAIEDGVLLPLVVRIVDIIDETSTTVSSEKHSRAEKIEYRLRATDLTVCTVYQCQLLVTRSIQDGWLNPQELLIPCDLSTELAVGTGLIGATQDEWTDYRGMFARAARQHRQEHVTGYSGIYYMDWSGRQPPHPPKSTENTRLNVSPYIIANNVVSAPEVDHNQRHQQQSRDQLRDEEGRRSVSSSALTSHRPLPPYRPLGGGGGGASSVSASCILSVPVTAAPPGGSRRVRAKDGGSLDCMLPRKHALTSSLSTSSSNSSSRSLPVTSVDEIEVSISDDVDDRLLPRPAHCHFVRETGVTSSFNGCVDQPAIGDGDVTVSVTSSPSSVVPLPTKTFPPTNCPRMGKRQPIPVSLMKNSSSIIVPSSTASALPTADSAAESIAIAGFGGSMPCLQSSNKKELTPALRQKLLHSKVALRRDIERLHHQQQQHQQPARVRFSVDLSTVSTSSVDHRGLQTSGSSLFDEEGYYTKESSISGSSLSGRSSSNGTTSSRRLLDIEPAFF